MPRTAAGKRKNPVFEIVMETDAVMRGELYPAHAPQTVGHFIALANAGFYDGLTFHRCIRGFIAQAGKPPAGKPPYCIQGEFEFNGCKLNRLPQAYGSLCLSRGGHYNSGYAQFFIVVATDKRELSMLNGAYAVFGKVTEGMRVAEALSEVKTNDANEPLHSQIIRRVRVETFGEEYPFEQLVPPTLDINLPKIKHRAGRTAPAENQKEEGFING